MRWRVEKWLIPVTICLILIVVGLWLLRYLRPEPYPEWAKEADLLEACEAAESFYAKMRQCSPVTLPKAKEFWSQTEEGEPGSTPLSGFVQRTQNGRPYVSVSASLESEFSDGHRRYTALGCDYDLFAKEIIGFSFYSPTVSPDPPYNKEFNDALRAELVDHAKAFAAAMGDTEFVHDQVLLEEHGYGLRVFFNRVIDNVNYVYDRYELLMTREGVVISYLKRREWSELDNTNHLPENELKDRSRTFAAELKIEALDRAGELEEVRSAFAAGNPKVAHELSHPPLNGFVHSRFLFVTTWIRRGQTIWHGDSAVVIRIFLDARTGRVVERDATIYALQEAIEKAQALTPRH